MNIYKIECGPIKILLEQENCPPEPYVLELLEAKGVKYNWVSPPSYIVSKLSTLSTNGWKFYWVNDNSGRFTKEVTPETFQENIRSILDDSPFSTELRKSMCEYANLCLSYGYNHSETVMKTAHFVKQIQDSAGG